MIIQTELQWHWDFHVSRIISPPRGGSRPFPVGPRSPSRWSTPVLSPASHRAAVWVGHGVTARPRDAEWRSGVAAVLGYVTTKISSNIHLDITIIMFTTEEHYTIRIVQYATNVKNSMVKNLVVKNASMRVFRILKKLGPINPCWSLEYNDYKSWSAWGSEEKSLAVCTRAPKSTKLSGKIRLRSPIGSKNGFFTIRLTIVIVINRLDRHRADGDF